jgi:hypothetical protein
VEDFRLHAERGRDELERLLTVAMVDSDLRLAELQGASAAAVAVARLDSDLRVAELEGALGRGHGEA